MALDDFAQRVIERLNTLHNNPGLWVHQPWMGNQRPWVRIFRDIWNQHWPAVGDAHVDRDYPVLWFEMKCLTAREGHDGAPPFGIYVPVDERGINFGPRNYSQVSGHVTHYLPTPDEYRTILLCLSGCYQMDVSPWVHNVTNSINRYLHERHFVLGQTGYTLPRNSPREELDFGLITTDNELEESVESCTQFIKSRSKTIDWLMQAG